jgi:hypothetical protein
VANLNASPAGRWVAALLALLAGCAAPTPVESPTSAKLASSFADQTPEWMPIGALDAVVPLFDPERSSLASGIFVGPGLLLTAAHFARSLTRDDRGDAMLVVDGRSQRVHPVAIGDMDAPHGDWAVLSVPAVADRPTAAIHEPALLPDWRPEPGTEILLVGFAAGFFPDLDVFRNAPTPCVRAKVLGGATGQRSWYAVGDDVDLGGMSGGAAVVWNALSGRAEVIGVFRGYVEAERVSVADASFLGLPVGEKVTRRAGIAFEFQRLPASALP